MQSVQDRLNKTLKAKPTDEIEGLNDLRQRIIREFGSITTASRSMVIPYNHLSDMLCGRRHYPKFVKIVQDRLMLTDRQVLTLWPMLQRWPKEGRAS